jgi:Cu+-exporting ATPase
MVREFTLPVTGMTCANCAMNIERGVRKVHGVKSVNVNLASEQAVIAFDPEDLRLKDVVENINRELKPNPRMP